MSRHGWFRALSIRLRPNDAAVNYVELKPPASFPSSISFTAPGTLPGATSPLLVAPNGDMSYGALGGGGSVTSFSASPTALFDVTNPTTTPALSLKSQAAGTFLAAPTGAAGVPTARLIAFIDIASLVGTGANTIAPGNDSRFHTQGTDSGTTQTSFQLNSGASGVRLKNSGGSLLVRNAADSANADLSAANVTISGNLTVQGTTTTIDSNTLTVGDNVITLNNDVISGTPTENAGIEIRRGSSELAQLIWDETTDEWFIGTASALYRVSLAVEKTFTDADLIASVLTWNHNLRRQFFPVVLIDNNNKTVGCEITYTSANSLTADLSGLGPIPGTWRLVGG